MKKKIILSASLFILLTTLLWFANANSQKNEITKIYTEYQTALKNSDFRKAFHFYDELASSDIEYVKKAAMSFNLDSIKKEGSLKQFQILAARQSFPSSDLKNATAADIFVKLAEFNELKPNSIDENIIIELDKKLPYADIYTLEKKFLTSINYKPQRGWKMHYADEFAPLIGALSQNVYDSQLPPLDYILSIFSKQYGIKVVHF